MLGDDLDTIPVLAHTSSAVRRTYCLGIDPGAHGAMVLLGPAGDVVLCERMPYRARVYDLAHIAELVAACVCTAGVSRLRAYLEAPGYYAAGGRQIGASSAGSIGRCSGLLEMALVCRSVSYEVVHPRRWQAEAGIAPSMGATPKARAARLAAQLWPGVTWDRSAAAAEGKIDAALMAHACAVRYGGTR